MSDRTFQKVAGIAAVLVAVTALLYGIVFLFFVPPEQKGDVATTLRSLAENPAGTQLVNLLLAIGAGAASVAIVAIYLRTSDGQRGLALWSLGLGLAYSTLTLIHGIYVVFLVPVLSELHVKGDAAQQAAAVVVGSLPSAIDPSSFVKFFLSAVWLLVVGWLMLRSEYFPRALAYLALAAGLGEILLFVGTVTGTLFLILATGVPGTVLIGPLFWIWVGFTLWTKE
jgi:hypothetical protein